MPPLCCLTSKIEGYSALTDATSLAGHAGMMQVSQASWLLLLLLLLLLHAPTGCRVYAGWQYKGELTAGASQQCSEDAKLDLGAMWECPFFVPVPDR